MGKLIAIEGSDGSGKATQARKLFRRLQDLDVPVQLISFPNYNSESAALINMYLRGDFGSDPNDVNPFATAVFFAADRFASLHQWLPFYQQGGIIIADRYTGSNIAYHFHKFSDANARQNFIRWIIDLEFNRFRLPRPDLTIFLDMPPAVAAILRRDRGRVDIHENNSQLMNDSYLAYLDIARNFHWHTIPCAENNAPRPTTDILEDILPAVENILL